ncbi:uncharacterized protein LOC6559753 isoform X2 [Drosophila grimshawi]|uniref:uncharacterized protein LOC6559753 isoform X2 n=1 Tax=Drosophila grimshawi TaxID=7222 RepID=UPI000C870560|nr:uncharacterized protein LOC6559753 isoform X2 [Drosophila grimshawi]
MNKNRQQSAGGVGAARSYQYAAEPQAQAREPPMPQPPSYEQATHFDVPATAQVVIIQPAACCGSRSILH